ncbi:MAG: hypothetical protein HY329_19505 [Chloroflexi bacterium]|nr:hypothetical protein [Chloroflexota bacterium]
MSQLRLLFPLLLLIGTLACQPPPSPTPTLRPISSPTGVTQLAPLGTTVPPNVINATPAARPSPASLPVGGPPQPALAAPRTVTDLPVFALAVRPSNDLSRLAYFLPAQVSRPGGEGEGPRLLLWEAATGKTDVAHTGVDRVVALEWLDRERLLLAVGKTRTEPGGLAVKTLGRDELTWIHRLPEDAANVADLRLSPDGRLAAFVTQYFVQGPAPKVAIDVVGVDGQGYRRLAEPELYLDNVKWTPDSRQVTYHRSTGIRPAPDADTFAVSAEGGQPTKIYSGARLIGWASSQRAIWSHALNDIDSTHRLLVTPDWPPDPSRAIDLGTIAGFGGATWTDSEGYLVVAESGALWLMGATSNPGRKLLAEAAGGEFAFDPRWLPGKGVVYLSRTGQQSALKLLPLVP